MRLSLCFMGIASIAPPPPTAVIACLTPEMTHALALSIAAALEEHVELVEQLAQARPVAETGGRRSMQ